jgi:ankyrin repeat protein
MKAQLVLIWVVTATLATSILAGEIHDAAGSGDLERIRRLLNENPALVNDEDYSKLMGLTPLHVAADKGQREAVELLLEKGAKADPVWGVNGMTPLILAARANHPEIVRLLLAKRANPNGAANGTTGLHWAARDGYIEVVQLLLDGGADVNLRDAANKTPLHVVAASGTKEMAELLIARGADVNAKDKDGNTPWSLTVNHPDIAELLRKHGALGSDPVTDLIINGGNRFARSREITIDPINDKFPTIRIKDVFHPEAEPVVRSNPGKPFKFVLPDHGDGEYELTIQFLDGAGQPQEPILMRSITLDTTPPVVEIIEPKNNSTTDQGFVHLQAKVFDPTANGRAMPGDYRWLSVWVNGERFWDRNGSSVDIPRFNVQDGTNRISIVAIDEASNRTEAVVQWVVNLAADTTPPVLSDINLHPDRTGKVILPDDPEVEVMGHLDDSNAVVTASVNGRDPVRMNVILYKKLPPTFVRLIVLDEGENTLVLSAIDGAGNANDYKYTVVRSNRYRARLTSAGPGPKIREGYVSAMRDEGTTNEAHVLAVFVNDTPTTLEPRDADGNQHFRTTQPVPYVWHGFEGSLYVWIKWSDGEVY